MIAGLDVANVLEVFGDATADELDQGVNWYFDRWVTAAEMARRYRISLDRAAGIIAAVSPKMPWRENVTAAETVLDRAPGRGIGVNRAKGAAIRDGAPVGIVLQCPQCRRDRRRRDGRPLAHECSGHKVRHFARCIAAAGLDASAVAIDRHAYDIAVGRVTDERARKALDRVGAYEAVADVYRAAAAILGTSPAIVQAVTWVVWRARKGIRD